MPAHYHSGTLADVDLGPAPYLDTAASPDGRFLRLVAYGQPDVPVDVLDTRTGRRIHLTTQQQGIGPVVWTTWSNDGNWLFVLASGTHQVLVWQPSMTAPRVIAGYDSLLGDFAGLGTLPDR